MSKTRRGDGHVYQIELTIAHRLTPTPFHFFQEPRSHTPAMKSERTLISRIRWKDRKTMTVIIETVNAAPARAGEGPSIVDAAAHISRLWRSPL